MFSGKSLDGQSIFGEHNGFRAKNDGFPPFFWIDSFRKIIGKSSRIIRDLAHACIWMHCERCFPCKGLGLCPASPVLKQAWDLSFGYKTTSKTSTAPPICAMDITLTYHYIKLNYINICITILYLKHELTYILSYLYQFVLHHAAAPGYEFWLEAPFLRPGRIFQEFPQPTVASKTGHEIPTRHSP